MYEKYENDGNYYDDYYDDIIAKNLPSTISNSRNYIDYSVNKQTLVVTQVSQYQKKVVFNVSALNFKGT